MGTEADEHRYFEGLAVSHVLGGLDESDGRVFRSHLLECHDCRARVGELRALAHDLADVERDERRVRAAKSIETKRREVTDEDEDDGEESMPAVPTSRMPRLLLLLGLGALVGLAVWNLTLQNTIARQDAYVSNVSEANDVMEFGEEVSWTPHTDGVDASISIDGDRLAVLVRGLDSDASYAIFEHDDEGATVGSHPVRLTGERFFVLLPLEDDTERVLLQRHSEGPDVRQLVLEAELPRNRATTGR